MQIFNKYLQRSTANCLFGHNEIFDWISWLDFVVIPKPNCFLSLISENFLDSSFFYRQLHFLLHPQVAYGRINFHSESCLAVVYSIHFLAFGCLTDANFCWSFPLFFYDFSHLVGWFSNGFTFLYELEFFLSVKYSLIKLVKMEVSTLVA